MNPSSLVARLTLALTLATPTATTAAPPTTRPTPTTSRAATPAPTAAPRSTKPTTTPAQSTTTAAPGSGTPASTTAAPPSAQPGTTGIRVVLLPRREGDALPASIDAALRESLRDGLRSAGAAPVQPNAVDLSTCSDAACLGRLRAAYGVRFAVRATLAVVDRDYTLKLELLDTSAAVVAVYDERCALCGLTEARARLTEGATRLLRSRTPAAAPTPTLLQISTDPPGAELTLDGTALGRAPRSPTVSPGPHTLEARAPGHHPATQTLGARDGQTLAVHLHLAPEPREPRLRAPATLLGLGIPILTTGVALVALDGRHRCCDRPPLETTWPGAALVLAGTALTSIGAVLLHQTITRRRAKARAR